MLAPEDGWIYPGRSSMLTVVMLRTIRQYWITGAMAATGYVGDSPLFLLDYLLRFGRVAVLLALWRTVFAGRGVESGLSIGAVLTYTLLAEMFAEPLAGQTELGWLLFQGDISTRFLRPMGVVGQLAAEAVGRWVVGLALFSLPLLLVAPLLGVDPRPASALAALLFAISVILAVAVGLAIDFIFGGLVIALEGGVYAVMRLRLATAVVLSGALLPLALFPWGLGNVFGWLPFAAMASAPLRIYTGTGNALLLLTSQLAWAVVLWPVAGWTWRNNREKLSGYGG